MRLAAGEAEVVEQHRRLIHDGFREWLVAETLSRWVPWHNIPH